jgi:hypothetical protein
VHPGLNPSHDNDPVNPLRIPHDHPDLWANYGAAWLLEQLLTEILHSSLTGQIDGRFLSAMLADPALALRWRDEVAGTRVRLEERMLQLEGQAA